MVTKQEFQQHVKVQKSDPSTTTVWYKLPWTNSDIHRSLGLSRSIASRNSYGS